MLGYCSRSIRAKLTICCCADPRLKVSHSLAHAVLVFVAVFFLGFWPLATARLLQAFGYLTPLLADIALALAFCAGVSFAISLSPLRFGARAFPALARKIERAVWVSRSLGKPFLLRRRTCAIRIAFFSAGLDPWPAVFRFSRLTVTDFTPAGCNFNSGLAFGWCSSAHVLSPTLKQYGLTANPLSTKSRAKLIASA